LTSGGGGPVFSAGGGAPVFSAGGVPPVSAGGTERLLEAVDAYRDALEERTRERVPLDWAMTQNNLGNAQALLNERLGPLREMFARCTS
jgi:hypothetical protein